MSNETHIELPFPLIINLISAKYSETEKPSGLGYTLLKMIGSDAVSKNMPIRMVIRELGLPEDMFPIFSEELELLSSQKMIQFNSINLDSYVWDISFTKLGKDAFSKGVISKNPKDLQSTVYFAPGKRDTKFSFTQSFKEFSSEIREDFFGEVNLNADELEKFIKSDKSRSCHKIRQSEDIFDFTLKSSEMSLYGQKATLIFDSKNASFSLRDGDMDTNFIKSNYSFDYIAGLLDPALFDATAVKKWGGSDISWNNYEFMLPQNFSIQDNDLCFLNSEYCSISGNVLHAPDSLKKLDSNAIVISSAGAFAYRFIVGKIQLKGFDGQTKKNLVVRRSLSSEEKDGCLKEAVRSVNVAGERDRFLKCVQICQRMVDPGPEIRNILFDYLKNAPLQSYSSVAEELNGFKKEKWYRDLPDIIERSLSERSDLLKDGKSIADLLSSLSAELADKKTLLDWGSVLPLLFSLDSERNLEIADYCLSKGLSKQVVLRESGVLDRMIWSITGNEKITGSSPFFTTVSNIRYNLAELQKLTGIMSGSEYGFDIDSFSEEKHTKFSEHASTLSSYFSSFTSEIKSLKLSKETNREFEDIGKLVALFQNISGTLKNLNKKADEKGLRTEQDSRLVGILLGVKLEKILKSMDLDGSLNEMISKAHESGYLSESDFKILNDFREFRNKCAHYDPTDPNGPILRPSEKEKWVRLIFRLESPVAEVKK